MCAVVVVVVQGSRTVTYCNVAVHKDTHRTQQALGVCPPDTSRFCTVCMNGGVGGETGTDSVAFR